MSRGLIGRLKASVPGGLIGRLIIASTMLALIIAAAFAVLLQSIVSLRDSQRLAQHSQQVLATSNRLERYVIDLETGQRGFLLTGDERFLAPWTEARAAIPAESARLLELTGVPSQHEQARRIVNATNAYVREYSDPIVAAARRGDPQARSVAQALQGKQRVDAIRVEFDKLAEGEQRLATAREDRSAAAARRAIIAAVGGIVGTLVLVLGFASYLTRSIVGPIRRTAGMANRLAGGDLSARVPETGAAEVGVLERSFNTMAERLQRSRDELAASRARVVTAGDQARRRIERDLHDGVQQRLVSLALDLRTAESAVPEELAGLRSDLSGIAKGMSDAMVDLQEISRGIHPAILTEGGLRPAIRSLARRSAVPVETELEIERRLPQPIEVAAFYVVAEALTNAAKHSRASLIRVNTYVKDDRLHLSVADDGVGGADPRGGSGLIGLNDRVEALGGTITVDSPPGRGTTIEVELPVPAHHSPLPASR